MTIPADAGFVALTSDATISTLQMAGGALVTHDSTCQSGWTPAPGGTSAAFGRNKCYRKFEDAESWTSAQQACARAVGSHQAGSRGGALRGALVTVQELDENKWVGRLCRGDSLDRDCWVGLARRYFGNNAGESGGDFEWAELGVAVGESRYRSWATREPSDFKQDEVSTFVLTMNAHTLH